MWIITAQAYGDQLGKHRVHFKAKFYFMALSVLQTPNGSIHIKTYTRPFVTGLFVVKKGLRVPQQGDGVSAVWTRIR